MRLTRRPGLAGLALAALLSLTALSAHAAVTQVAVAANFTEPAKEIATAFAGATGHTANLSFGPSGQIYTQIVHGAPYEVFLSADVERPAKAEQENLAVPGSRFTYATGRLVLFSRTAGLVDGRGAVLRSQRFEKLAIADPAAAPYGVAAIQVMTRLGLYETLKPRLVQGSSIAQAYQFVQTGAAEIGFVALSQVIKETGGSRWLVPAADHAAIAQQAVLLRNGAGNPAATAFMTFLRSPASVKIIRSYGYEAR